MTLPSPLELKIFCEQEWAYDRTNLFLPLHLFFSWIIVLNALASHEVADWMGSTPKENKSNQAVSQDCPRIHGLRLQPGFIWTMS